jgi:hypothetical protein
MAPASTTFIAGGTGVLTLDIGGPSGFASQLVTIEPQTSGVLVVLPSQTFGPGQAQGTWGLTGLTPGMTAKFKVDAVDAGGGSKPGTDECCSGIVEVTVPPETTDGDDDEVIDLDIKKTGVVIPEGQMGPAGEQHFAGYTFTLAVTNVGAGFNGTNAIIVTDVVPAGLKFTNAAGTDWNCGPTSQFPIVAGGTLTCTYVGSLPLTTGQALPSITVNASMPGFPTSYAFENCADVDVPPSAGETDVNPANDRSCLSDAHSRSSPPPTSTSTSVSTPLACDKASTRLKDGACECRYPGMKQTKDTSCKCPAGQTLVKGEGCVKKPLACDDRSTQLRGETCQCLYQGMTRTSKTMCACPEGNILVTGIGCVVPGKPTTSTSTSTTTSTTTTTTSEPKLECKEPMVPNKKGDACKCPKGTELKGSECVKKRSIFGDVLDNVNIGVGIGGNGGGGGGGSTPKPDIVP